MTRWGVLMAALSIGLAIAGGLYFAPQKGEMIDERLIGVWQSDAERTIAGIRDAKNLDDERTKRLTDLFGKLRVTYSRTTLTTQLDDYISSRPYHVLGRDKNSVVIQDLADPVPEMESFQPSTFAVIHFESPDSYWVHIEFSSDREWFKRID